MGNDSNDRLIFTLLFSVIIHVALVLGVSFNIFSSPTNTPVNNLDITLVKQQTVKPPEEADFLAQADNEGGGELDTPTPDPSPDLPVPLAEDSPSSAPQVQMTEVEPVTPTPEVMPQVTQPAPEPTPAPAPTPEAKPEPTPKVAAQKVTTKEAERKVESVEADSETQKSAEDIAEPTPPRPSASELMAQARNEISSLQEQLERTSKALSERPKKRRISAATKEFAAAAYMRSWEMKVERIGNMNYPQEAREKGINGSLMLSVDIRPDGSVPPDGIVVSRSSGHKVLDDAAIKIVRLGAPYAEIPKDVLKDNDMLTIIRTWKFESQRGLSAR
ncbi:energy transducer TonB [Methylophaga sp. OBS3]|uniref:energy transducer TonB n=1 Tax=Methylophaga sp. OBS3 TaxID=2991934 RepID=UPI0022553188|nr:energy transducer TonB [Methylophaga sp. OBS3]MCX4189530.1 TonB family protein [Methylophaga sp. OBS3]